MKKKPSLLLPTMTDNTGRGYVRAEDNHTFPQLKLPSGFFPSAKETDDHGDRARSSLGNLPANAFAIKNFFTAKECSGLVALAEQTGFKPVSWEYNPV